MTNIILISTVHEEIGKCNADALCEIIRRLSPEVIFLEADDKTYSNYEKSVFSSFDVYNKKLEIAAIQKYSLNASFEYVPVLDNELFEAFDKKYSIVCQNHELQWLLSNFNSLTGQHGFEFLNSIESIKLHEEMRMLENRLLNDSELNKAAIKAIDAYEDSMMRNIYAYCKSNKFNTAIFMCGSAHRKSIIEKIEKLKVQEETDVSWTIHDAIATRVN